MKTYFKLLLASALLSAVAALPPAANAAAPKSVKIAIKTADGKDAGKVVLNQGKAGVEVKVDLKNLPPGEHANPHPPKCQVRSTPTSRPLAATSTLPGKSTDTRILMATTTATCHKTSP